MCEEIAASFDNQRSYLFDSDIPVPTELDLFVDGASDVRNLERLTYTLFPCLIGSTLTIKVLDEGYSNLLVLVSCAQRDDNAFRFLIRINGISTNTLVDRNLELDCLIALYKLRGTPEVYCKFNNGICYSFASGTSMITSDLFHNEYKWLICDELAHFHSLPMHEVLSRCATTHAHSNGLQINGDPVAFQRLREWIKNLPNRIADDQQNDKYHSLFPTADYLLREVISLENTLSNAKSPVVFCHNDLLSGNIILSENKDKVTFIDYEYCGFNHAAYDIANHFCEYGGMNPFDPTKYPSLAFQREWIDHYLRRTRCHQKLQRDTSHSLEWLTSDKCHPINGDCLFLEYEEVEEWLREVNYFSLVAHLTWGIWAAVRTSDGPHDFDFLSFAIARLQEYKRIKPLILAHFSG